MCAAERFTLAQATGKTDRTLPFLLQIAAARRLRLFLCGAYAVLYVFIHWVTFFAESSTLRTTPWNPETGLTVAAGVLLGWYSVPFAFAAHLIGSLITKADKGLAMLAPYAFAYAVLFAGAASLFRQARSKDGAQSTRFLAKFLALSFALSMMAAAINAGIAPRGQSATYQQLAGYTLTRAVGDLIGILTVAPLLLMAERRNNIVTLTVQNPAAVAAAVIGITSVAFVVFGLENTDEFKYFYVLFIPLIVLAMKYGLTGAALGVVVSDLAMIGIISDRDFSATTATELQILMVSLATTALILGSVVSERSRLSSELIKSHDKLRESQSALIQASRVSLVSEMATALAHELNQPLSSVRNYVRAIQRMLERPRVDRERVRDVIGQAVVQIDSASSLIQQTRRFLRRGEVHLERADLRQIIMMSIELVRPELRRTSIILKTDLPDYIPAVSANAIQIQQVIVNLLRNARDSIVDSASDLREIRISASTRGRPGFVEVAVSDSGPGIADEIRPHLFRPFQSSKPDGLGLGLSLCSSIVSAHGGELWLDEQVNGRTRFIFTLKFHQSSAFAT